MKIRKIVPGILLMALFMSTSLNATESPDPTIDGISEAENHNTLQERADALMLEILDLRKAKKEATSRDEKREIKMKAKELRSELNALEAEAKAKGQAINGGIYIGTATLLVILILVLLL